MVVVFVVIVFLAFVFQTICAGLGVIASPTAHLHFIGTDESSTTMNGEIAYFEAPTLETLKTLTSQKNATFLAFDYDSKTSVDGYNAKVTIDNVC